MRRIEPEDLPRAALETSYRLGRLVAGMRKARGLSQQALCAEARLGRSTLVEIEHGSPRVQFAYWLQVMNALELLDSLNDALGAAEVGMLVAAIKRPRRPRQ